MDMDGSLFSAHDSIYVAPLRIEKRCPSASSRTSRKSTPRTHKHPQSHSLHPAQHHIDFTPPTTPDTSEVPDDRSPDFHPFLRAFYPFHPTYTSGSSTVTLPLNSGDLILVHSVHTNGWADGTMLSSGARGWLPTNYCETYDTTHIRLLLRSSANLFEQFRVGSCGGARINQLAVSAVIAGVRHLLESTECLTRESPNVRACDLIRKSRKTLLTELSGLVKAAKKLSHSSIEYADEITDELILRTFKIVLRGVRFLDVWYEQYEITGNFIDSYRDEYVDVEVGVTVLSAPQSASVRSSVSASLHSQCSESETGGYFGMSGRNQSIRELANRSHPLPSTPVIQTPRLSNELRCRHVVVETLEIQTEAPSSVFALARLNTTQDALLSYLGSYIGRIHQPQARFTPQLQLTQQQSVAAARDLVAVVEAVLVRDPRPNPRLEKAKDSMYIHINTLIAAAYEAITNRTEGMDEEEEGVLILDSGRSLVEAATGCVRGAGDCVGKSKIVIEKIGDFELETRALNIGLGITTDSAQPIAVEEQSQVSTANPEEPETQVEGPESLQAVIDRQKMPPPPAPERAPLPIQPKNRSASIPLSVDTNLLPATSVVPPTPARILETPEVASRRSSVTSLLQPIANSSPSLVQGAFDQKKDSEAKLLFNKSVRADSFGAESISATSADSIGANSLRGSEFSMLSQTSTRATTPEPNSATSTCTPLLNTDLTLSQTSLVSATGSICEMHGDDLTFNKDGQITGGTLAALVEKLTVHDSTPDAVFVATFYLTFRLFATPKEFAEALVKRFESVSEASGAMPVRLRVYNVFKGWMESHWRQSQDYDALEVIRVFGETILSAALPAAAKRLLDLAEKVSDMDGPLVPRFVCSMGKTASSSATYSLPETPIPSPAISRSQINALKNSLAPGGMSVSILDFEPMELARQFTLKESRMFCSIRPEELIAQEWTKKKDSLAVNVLGMSSLSTDLAHLVAETILDVQDIKKRAVVIKQWIKIADRCLELNNYDSLMAIMCTMNTSTIGRLKKTWELVSFKTKQALDNLRAVIDVSKNHAVLRARLRGHVPPCLPFLGTYLTDLTFVDVGNPSKRPVSTEGSTKQLINFDKHVKTARIISELQRFQIPYRIAEIPEMQTWIDFEISRIHNSKAADVQHLYRRSLLLEPRENQLHKPATESPSLPPPPPSALPREPSGKLDLFSWSHFRASANS